MRILLVHNIYRHPGGEETYIKNLTHLLRSHGHTVKCIFENSSVIHGVRNKIFTGFGLFWNFKSYSAISRVIAEFRPDVVQFQNIFPLFSPSVYWACKKHGVPIVQRISNYRLVCPKTTLFRSGKICEACITRRQSFLPAIYFGCVDNSRLATFIYAASFLFHTYVLRSFTLINAYIFPSEFTMKYIAKHFSTSGSLTFHVPSPVIAHKSPSDVRRDDGRYFVYVGRISAEKGVLNLVRMFSQPRFSHMRLKIAGDGPDAEKVRMEAKGSPNILILGKLNKQELAPLISNALAMIAPSIWYDVQPNSVLESLLYQTPVIAPASPVFKELLADQLQYVYKNKRQMDHILRMVWNKKKKDIVKLPQPHLPSSHYEHIVSIYRQIISGN